MARLAVEKETLRNLALRSRNQCAFPGCTHPIMNDKNELVAELCHIEAAEEGGQRYNSAQSDEQRRSYENLMFLCHRHHKETDDVSIFTPEKLREMKSTHESLPVSVHNPDRIVEAVSRLERQAELLQQQIEKFVEAKGGGKLKLVVGTSEGDRQFAPEQEKMYVCIMPDSTLRVMVKGELACIEQTFKDGAIAYYEIDSAGGVKESKFPYPLESYQLIVPPEMIVWEDTRSLGNGLTETRYTLKWARSVVAIRDAQGRLAQLQLNARSRIEHAKRRIEVVCV